MENASKALIIAGAILLAILLISLGIYIFSQAQDTVNNSGMSQAQAAAFNNQFIKYEGTRKGSVVKSLINEVRASNADDNNSNRKVSVQGGGNSAYTEEPVSSGVEASKSYTIKIEEYKNGCVSKISITE